MKKGNSIPQPNNNNIFWKRFSELRAGENDTQVAEKLGLDRRRIGQWKDGAMPNTEALQRIAIEYKCNINWLIGASDIRSTDPNIESVVNYTGLSERAVKELHLFKSNHAPALYFDQLINDNACNVLSELIERRIIQKLVHSVDNLSKRSSALLAIKDINNDTYQSANYFKQQSDIEKLNIYELLYSIAENYDERRQQPEEYKELQNKISEFIDSQVLKTEWKTDKMKVGD